jgi:hypothetical protein
MYITKVAINRLILCSINLAQNPSLLPLTPPCFYCEE